MRWITLIGIAGIVSISAVVPWARAVGDLPRAEADLAIARKQAPDDPDIHATYAVTLESKLAHLEALRELDAVIRKYPEHVYARQEAARLSMKFGHYQVALQNLNVVVERRPTVNVLVQRSETFLALGKPQSAAADLSAALKIEPNQFMLTIARADADAAAGLGELALHDYDSVLTMDRGVPLYVMFDNDRAKLLAKRTNVYIQLKRFDDAAHDMVTAVGLGGVPATARTSPAAPEWLCRRAARRPRFAAAASGVDGVLRARRLLPGHHARDLRLAINPPPHGGGWVSNCSGREPRAS
jgi:tetratricopeptide (TPR) repeat protein